MSCSEESSCLFWRAVHPAGRVSHLCLPVGAVATWIGSPSLSTTAFHEAPGNLHVDFRVQPGIRATFAKRISGLPFCGLHTLALFLTVISIAVSSVSREVPGCTPVQEAVQTRITLLVLLLQESDPCSHFPVCKSGSNLSKLGRPCLTTVDVQCYVVSSVYALWVCDVMYIIWRYFLSSV